MKPKNQANPEIFFMKKKKDVQRLRYLLKKKKYIKVIDYFSDFLEELVAIRNPNLRRDAATMRKEQRRFVNSRKVNNSLRECGVWVYYPWLEKIVHIPNEEEYYELRTARNKNLITQKEQNQFNDITVAIAGLSVGSHAALAIAMQGGAKFMRLADPDLIAPSNLNRIRVGCDMVGKNKTIAVAEQLYAINPFSKLKLFPRGLSIKSLRDFLMKPKKVGVLIEETDDISLKILIRREAKRMRIPVIMATDNGDGIILDVERFDKKISTPIMRGRADSITRKQLTNATPAVMAQIITNLVDRQAISARMKSSVDKVGTSLYSWPQLGGAAQLAGSALAYAVRMIATNGPLKTGRTKIAFEDIFSFGKL
jgi:tRNA A37 threonylcarbamoyladenosine dehydratase